MSFNTVQNICQSLPFVTEEFPFDECTITWKVYGKIFCLGNIQDFSSINVKCDAEKAIELREKHYQITPGYHMNKKLWNSVELDGLSEKLVEELILHSYSEVVQKLPLKYRTEILNRNKYE